MCPQASFRTCRISLSRRAVPSSDVQVGLTSTPTLASHAWPGISQDQPGSSRIVQDRSGFSTLPPIVKPPPFCPSSAGSQSAAVGAQTLLSSCFLSRLSPAQGHARARLGPSLARLSASGMEKGKKGGPSAGDGDLCRYMYLPCVCMFVHGRVLLHPCADLWWTEH